MNDHAHDFDTLSRRLADAGVVMSVPELHGGMCGVMCIAGGAAAEQWLNQCLDEWRPQANGDVGESLRELELDTWRMLTEADMTFEPLLPDDDEPLDAQVHALALWCHGFLTGLGFGGLKLPVESLDSSGALAEITKDFAEISRATLSADDATDLEQAGFALAELKEYVRVGVQLVFEEFGGRHLDADSDNIH